MIKSGDMENPAAGKEFPYKYEYHVSGMHCSCM